MSLPASVKVNTIDKVREHVAKYGGSLANFYDMAALEKIRRDTAIAVVGSHLTPDDIAFILDKVNNKSLS